MKETVAIINKTKIWFLENIKQLEKEQKHSKLAEGKKS